jgi:hypothetical protein
MSPDNVVEWAKAVAIFGAIVFGGFAVFSPSWVWFRIQTFKLGSGLLLGFGTVLLVSPIFSNIYFSADANKVELKLSALEAQVQQARTNLASLTKEITVLPAKYAANSQALENRVSTIQASLAAIEKEFPKYAALGNQVEKVRQTVATVEKSVKKIDNQTTLLASLNSPMFANLAKTDSKHYKSTWDPANYPGMAAFSGTTFTPAYYSAFHDMLKDLNKTEDDKKKKPSSDSSGSGSKQQK